MSWNNATDARSASTPAANVPTACPACRSSSVTTTAKNPDENSYWRCEKCGEVWNVSRWHAERAKEHRWW